MNQNNFVSCWIKRVEKNTKTETLNYTRAKGKLSKVEFKTRSIKTSPIHTVQMYKNSIQIGN